MWYFWFLIISFLLCVLSPALFNADFERSMVLMSVVVLIGSLVALVQTLVQAGSATIKGVSVGRQLLLRRIKSSALSTTMAEVSAAFFPDPSKRADNSHTSAMELELQRPNWALYLSYELIDDIGHTCLSLSGGGYFPIELQLCAAGSTPSEPLLAPPDATWKPTHGTSLDLQITFFLQDTTSMYLSGDAASLLLLFRPNLRDEIQGFLHAEEYQVQFGAIELEIPGYIDDAALLIPRLCAMEALAGLLEEPEDIASALLSLVQEDPVSRFALYALELLLDRYPDSPATAAGCKEASSSQRPAFQLLAARAIAAQDPADIERFLELYKDTPDAHLCEYALDSLAHFHPDVAKVWIDTWLQESLAKGEQPTPLFLMATAVVQAHEMLDYLPLFLDVLQEVLSPKEGEKFTGWHLEEALGTLQVLGDESHEPLLLSIFYLVPLPLRAQIAEALAEVGTSEGLRWLLEALQNLHNKGGELFPYTLTKAYERAIEKIRVRLDEAEVGALSLADEEPTEEGGLSIGGEGDVEEGAVSLVSST